MIKVYCVLSERSGAIDVSKTEHGAKCYATRNGYNRICKRIGYNCLDVQVKTPKGWKAAK